MTARTVPQATAIALVGLEGIPVKVEADLSPGMVGMTIVGDGDASLREAKERLRSAMLNCGLKALTRRLTVNLSPADLPKTGAGFDLAMAVSILCARRVLDKEILAETVFIGELGLDGSLRPVPAALALVLAARSHGYRRVVVPQSALETVSIVEGMSIHGISHLNDLLRAFPGTEMAQGGPGHAWSDLPAAPHNSGSTKRRCEVDLSEVRGHPEARYVLMIAASGGHHLLLHGPPGGGKTMLAERLHTLLPDLTLSEATILAAMRSIAGVDVEELTRMPPMEMVSPGTTSAALVGGGTKMIRPGAVSLAHRGVLVLDEAPEFSQRVLENLRGPLETGRAITRRAANTVSYPAQFQLVLTANPCPCGLDGTKGLCQCTPMSRRRYQEKLSGPLRDRLDIRYQVLAPHLANIEADMPLGSESARERVTEARHRAQRRWGRAVLNREVTGTEIRNQGGIDSGFLDSLNRAIGRGWMTMRGADKVLRLGWSIADLAGRDAPNADDFSFALQLRNDASGGVTNAA